MTIVFIIFAIVLLHLVVGLAWAIYKIFSKPNQRVSDDKAESSDSGGN